MSDGEITVIGPECFASTDDTVVSWKGANYYQACDAPVVQNADGSGTHCVKRVDHPGDIHEDYDGIRKTQDKGRMAIVVTFPLNENTDAGYKDAQDMLQMIKPIFANMPEVRVYGAVKESADQLIMILEGDG